MLKRIHPCKCDAGFRPVLQDKNGTLILDHCTHAFYCFVKPLRRSLKNNMQKTYLEYVTEDTVKGQMAFTR